LKPRQVTAIFRKPVRDFQPECNRLGVHAVRAANLRRILEFPRAPLQHLAHPLERFLNLLRSFAHQQRLRRVHHVV